MWTGAILARTLMRRQLPVKRFLSKTVPMWAVAGFVVAVAVAMMPLAQAQRNSQGG